MNSGTVSAATSATPPITTHFQRSVQATTGS